MNRPAHDHQATTARCGAGPGMMHCKQQRCHGSGPVAATNKQPGTTGLFSSHCSASQCLAPLTSSRLNPPAADLADQSNMQVLETDDSDVEFVPYTSNSGVFPTGAILLSPHVQQQQQQRWQQQLVSAVRQTVSYTAESAFSGRHPIDLCQQPEEEQQQQLQMTQLPQVTQHQFQQQSLPGLHSRSFTNQSFQAAALQSLPGQLASRDREQFMQPQLPQLVPDHELIDRSLPCNQTDHGLLVTTAQAATLKAAGTAPSAATAAAPAAPIAACWAQLHKSTRGSLGASVVGCLKSNSQDATRGRAFALPENAEVPQTRLVRANSVVGAPVPPDTIAQPVEQHNAAAAAGTELAGICTGMWVHQGMVFAAGHRFMDDSRLADDILGQRLAGNQSRVGHLIAVGAATHARVPCQTSSAGRLSHPGVSSQPIHHPSQYHHNHYYHQQQQQQQQQLFPSSDQQSVHKQQQQQPPWLMPEAPSYCWHQQNQQNHHHQQQQPAKIITSLHQPDINVPRTQPGSNKSSYCCQVAQEHQQVPGSSVPAATPGPGAYRGHACSSSSRCHCCFHGTAGSREPVGERGVAGLTLGTSAAAVIAAEQPAAAFEESAHFGHIGSVQAKLPPAVLDLSVGSHTTSVAAAATLIKQQELLARGNDSYSQSCDAMPHNRQSAQPGTVIHYSSTCHKLREERGGSNSSNRSSANIHAALVKLLDDIIMGLTDLRSLLLLARPITNAADVCSILRNWLDHMLVMLGQQSAAALNVLEVAAGALTIAVDPSHEDAYPVSCNIPLLLQVVQSCMAALGCLRGEVLIAALAPNKAEKHELVGTSSGPCRAATTTALQVRVHKWLQALSAKAGLQAALVGLVSDHEPAFTPSNAVAGCQQQMACNNAVDVAVVNIAGAVALVMRDMLHGFI